MWASVVIVREFLISISIFDSLGMGSLLVFSV